MNYIWSLFFDDRTIPELQKPTRGYCLIDGKRGTGKTTLAMHLLKDYDYATIAKITDWDMVDIDTVRAVYIKGVGVIDRSWGYFKLRELISRCQDGENVLVVIETQMMATMPGDLRQPDYLFDTDNNTVLSNGMTYLYPFMTELKL